MLAELPKISRVEVVDIQPGDVIVVTFDASPRLTHEDAAHAVALLKERYPDNPVLIVQGASIKVARSAGACINGGAECLAAPDAPDTGGDKPDATSSSPAASASAADITST